MATAQRFLVWMIVSRRNVPRDEVFATKRAALAELARGGHRATDRVEHVMITVPWNGFMERGP